MHDVIILYNHPLDPEAFDNHYRNVHIPLVRALPHLKDFVWGKPSDAVAGYYLVARLTYESSDDAARSLKTPEGIASVDDLSNFAAAGVTVLNVPRRS